MIALQHSKLMFLVSREWMIHIGSHRRDPEWLWISQDVVEQIGG